MAKILGVPETVFRAQTTHLFGLGDEAQAGAIGTAAAKAACVGSGGVWIDSVNQCLQGRQPITNAVEEQALPRACAQAGGTWSNLTQRCTMPPTETNFSNIVGLVGGIVLGWIGVDLVRR